MQLPGLLLALLDRQRDGHALYAPHFTDSSQDVTLAAPGAAGLGGRRVVRLSGVYMNPVGLALREMTEAQFDGSDLLERLAQHGSPQGLQACLRVVHGGQPLHREVFAEQQADRRCAYEVDAVTVPQTEEVPWLLHVAFRDVTGELEGRRRLERTATELEHLARTDPLTGLANRRAWQPALAEAVRRAASATAGPPAVGQKDVQEDVHKQDMQDVSGGRDPAHSYVPAGSGARPARSRLGQPSSDFGSGDGSVELCVAIADLDRFKDFNDRNGHPAGDELLRQFGAVWGAELIPGQVLARLGGEEFGLLLPGTGLRRAVAVCERLRTLVPGGQTVSFGLTCWRPGELAETMMGRADTALYAAKNAGRDRVVALLAP